LPSVRAFSITGFIRLVLVLLLHCW
jgi:hypothetical protein